MDELKFKIATANSRTDKYFKNIDISWLDLKARLKSPTRSSETFEEFKNFSKSRQSSLKDVGGFIGGYLKGISWLDLKARLKSPTRSSETFEEFKNFSKSRQSSLKDVGGFIGGYLKGGKRNKENLLYRSLLVLDVDFPDEEFTDLISLYFNFSYIIYSTRKYEAEKPRYRLIIPFSRNCSAEEYEAVGRKIAEKIGISQFDETTFQPCRLMYYPSISYNQEFVFIENTTHALDVDNILAEYEDWKDTSSWPSSESKEIYIQKEVKKQKNPLEKDGLVGAFCRVYDIEKAIDTFLEDEYEKCENSNRYTYKKGSTFAGAVIYQDGNFIYSNHSTDPINGKLCNAFDLVRIHRFGTLDEDVDEKCPHTKLPSYLEMLKFCSKDNEVKLHINESKRQQALSDFDFEIEENTDWLKELEVDAKGKNISSIHNVLIILRNDSILRDKVKYNEFVGREVIEGKVPWSKKKEYRYFEDYDDSGLRYYLEKSYGIKGKLIIEDGKNIFVKDNSFHPVKEYLTPLKWDNVNRIETFFIDYLGAEDNKYTREVTKKTFVGAVKRIFEPGCKFDTMLVLVGKQGKGKTEIIKKIGKKWFSDNLRTFKGKEAYEQLQGAWIIEIGEMEAMKTAELETIKHFLTKTDDSFRGAYAKYVKDFKRQCIFFGTTNNRSFLKDPTGDRRFYPVDIFINEIEKDIWKDLTDYEIDQLWAEACHLYRNGELCYITDKEVLKMAEYEQKSHKEDIPIQGVIEEFLNTPIPSNWKDMDLFERRAYYQNPPKLEKINGDLIFRDKVCVLEIWMELLGGDKKDLDRKNSTEIKNCLLRIEDWEQSKSSLRFRYPYGVQKGFIRINHTNSVVLNFQKCN